MLSFRKDSFIQLILAILLLCFFSSTRAIAQMPEIEIIHNSTKKYDGRLLFFMSTDEKQEPRFSVGAGLNTQLVFGQNVENWNGEQGVLVGDNAFGFPLEKISELPAGTYYVQALLHVYETFNRADGHQVKLPMNRGAGQNWRKAPGNLYSKTKKINFDPTQGGKISLILDQVNPDIEPPADTDYVKHIKIRSEKLSKFWGRDMYLGAHVLLPEGWAEHTTIKYPLAIYQGHFPADMGEWSETPPDKSVPCEYSSRFDLDCYNQIVAQEKYDTYRAWTGPNFPRVIAIEIQHANPFYDDSYAVNSQNLGPYGDAIMYELIPYIENKFRGIGEGWARFTYGGSTGGWEALATQVLYPDELGGCYAACPDPIDFRHYVSVDLYKDKNAYWKEGAHRKVERPERRDYLGHISVTMKNSNHYELAIGDKGRSGDQYDIWQAVYGPVGADGYPQPIWDKYTGEIDKSVAEYWKENYDLRHIMQRDWATLGPKLKGKVHIYCGDMDNYYLNNAVYLAEDFLESTSNPYYEGEVDYGDRAEHCWNGDHEQPNAISRMRYHRMFIKKWAEEINSRAPSGADLQSWRY